MQSRSCSVPQETFCKQISRVGSAWLGPSAGRHVHHSVQSELDDGKMTFGGRFSEGFLIFGGSREEGLGRAHVGMAIRFLNLQNEVTT